jgi:hypothetical protein
VLISHLSTLYILGTSDYFGYLPYSVVVGRNQAMATCTRIGFVSSTLLKSTQYSNGSVASRARYACIKKCEILVEITLNLEFFAWSTVL